MSDSRVISSASAPLPGSADPLIGLVVDGRYRVLSRMARGGMASVYIAEDQRLDRQVALKIMHPHLAESEQFTARFRQEARSAAKISNPGIVPVYDQGTYQGQGYLVMELIDGPNLRDYIATSGPITLGTALDITQQLLTSLSAAHSAGVVHRDLKPENVLVGPDGTMKITDFGLARAASEVTMSSTGTVLGTVAYLAPEVALRGDFDGRTDIYGVGIMLFEMLTGSVPGEGAGTPIQLALSRVNNDIPAPSTEQSWLPAEVDDLTTALAARDATDRPLSAKDASALVERTKRALPAEVLSHPLPSSSRTQSLSSDSSATQAMRYEGQTTWLPIQQNIVHTSGAVSDEAPKGDGRRRSKTPIVVLTVLLLLAGAGLGFWWWWQQYGPGAYLEVPDLAGVSVSQAQSQLEQMNLASGVEYQNHDQVAIDDVIDTEPQSGRPVHKDAEVKLFASKGVLHIDVPDVANRTADAAKKAIEEAGLKVGKTTEQWSADVAAGNVISTSPTAKANVDHRTPIDLTVSKGREPVTIPNNVLGRPTDEIKAELESLGITVTISDDYSDDYAVGHVAAISAEPGTQVLKGDSISLTNSLGSKWVTVPNVIMLSRNDAIATLEYAGLTVETNEVVSFLGIVGRQSIGGGEVVERGTTVVIDIV